MKNADSWTPSKFVVSPSGLAVSSDPSAVATSSRTAAGLVASFYDRVLPLYADGRLLDLGCGTVPLFGSYRDLVQEVVCVDWANTPHQNRHIDVVHDLTLPLPFESARFDTIILSDVLEHIAEPAKLWDEMARVLAPAGHLILNVPFCYWLHEEPHDYYRFTEFALKRFAEESGFEIVELAPLGGSPQVLTDILSKTLAMSKRGRRAIPLLQKVSGRFIRSRIGSRITARTARKFPLAYGMVAKANP